MEVSYQSSRRLRKNSDRATVAALIEDWHEPRLKVKDESNRRPDLKDLRVTFVTGVNELQERVLPSSERRGTPCPGNSFIDRRFYVVVLVNPKSLVCVFSFCLTLAVSGLCLPRHSHPVQEPRCLAGPSRSGAKSFAFS